MRCIRPFVCLLIPVLLLGIISIPLRALSDTDTTGSLPVSRTSVLPAIPSLSTGNWHIETVDSGGGVSLALDGSGQPHISYSDSSAIDGDELNYAWRMGTTWYTETVDSEEVFFSLGHVSLALDGMGWPYISYKVRVHFTPLSEYVKYAWHDGRRWQIESVDSTFGCWGDSDTSLALDSSGRPHNSYPWCRWDSSTPPPLVSPVSEGLKYAWRDATGWNSTMVDDEGGAYPSLALDRSDRPHIAYARGGVNYARYDGTAWHSVNVDGEGSRPSLVLDSLDRPHIAYSSGGVKHAWYDGSTWHIETVDGAGGSPSLALDSSGRPHIAYSSSGVKYAWRDGTTWHIDTVDGGGSSPSLALNSSDQPRISYSDGDVKYAQLMSPFRIDKRATPGDGLRNRDILTYTLTLSGPGLSVQLWDPLPASVDYITDSVTRPGTYNPIHRAVEWQGTLPADAVKVFRFRVTPGISGTGALSLSQPIVNTAWLTDMESGASVSATAIVNGWRYYMPIVLRQ